MKKKKDLETELKRLNIPFEKRGNLYCLWPQYVFGNYEKEFESQRKCWRHVRKYANSYYKHLKAEHNSKERRHVRDEIYHERYENLDGHQFGNHRNWD